MNHGTDTIGTAAAEQDTPVAIYDERCTRFAAARDRYDRLSQRLANSSLALFVATLACAGASLWQRSAIWALLAVLAAMGFLASYSYHAQVDRRHQRAADLWAINDEGRQRLARNWAALPLRQPPKAIDDATADDLDVLGHASLYHLIGTAYTPTGRTTLQRWLLQPAADVAARQVAVAELAPQIELRDELALRGRALDVTASDVEPFLRWAEGAPWLAQRRWLVWVARVSPLALIITAALQTASVLSVPIWLVFAAINLALTFTIGRQVDTVIDRINARQRVFQVYAALLAFATHQPFAAPLLRALQERMTSAGHGADQQMRHLGRIMALADLRGWMLFLPVQIATLWNIHVLWLLERWQWRAGTRVRDWLGSLGELEALAALATLKHDHPDWSFPTLTHDEPPLLQAQQLGHPLLVPQACIQNDITVGPPGTFVLVTGSNMSGKSTLLRAIGVNVTLAQAGGPVCAAALRLPPLVLATSMRVQDSLEQGVSYFMAELQRLKAVVDRAEQLSAEKHQTLLFLLDEILHGTNTSERQIAARQIIRHLLRQRAIGVVSTHDLALADAPDLAAASQPVHFRETFTRGPDGPSMHFDYRLRPGVATSTNALKLMEIIGLPVDALPDEPYAAPSNHCPIDSSR